MRKVKNALLAVLTLLNYLLVGLTLLGVDLPMPHPDMLLDLVFKQEFATQFIAVSAITIIQVYFGFMFALAALGSYYAQCVLYQFDVMIASIVHGGRFRSISGYLGYKKLNNLASLRWYIAAGVVNAIFFFDENHCESTYKWETEMGFWGDVLC